MRSAKPLDKDDTEDLIISNNGEVAKLEFACIETSVTPGKIYMYQTICFTVTSIKGTK